MLDIPFKNNYFQEIVKSFEESWKSVALTHWFVAAYVLLALEHNTCQLFFVPKQNLFVTTIKEVQNYFHLSDKDHFSNQQST